MHAGGCRSTPRRARAPAPRSAFSITVNWRLERCSALGPRPRFDARDVVDAHRPGRRRHGQPADLVRVAALVLEDADLDRILLLPFLVERDLIVARHREAQRVADRRHPHAEIGGALADRRRRGFRGSRRSDSAWARRGSASAAPPPASSASTRPAAADRDRECSTKSRSRPAPSPLPSALRAVMLGRYAGYFSSRLPHLGDHLRLRLLAVLDGTA